jgi:hypothetical protein
MWADFDMTGRITRVTDLTDRKTAAAYLVTLATTRSWKEKRQWKEKTFFHTLTIYDGFDELVTGLEVGDLVRFRGDIESWSTRIEGTDDYRQGVTLVARNRRIIARKRKGGDETGDESVAADTIPWSESAGEDIPY